MSKDFINFISELHSQRYLAKLKYIISNKIPCGFFVPFESESLPNIIATMKNVGLNLFYVYGTSENQKIESEIPFLTLEELPKSRVPKIIFHTDVEHAPAFYECFKPFGVELLTFSDINTLETMYNFFIQNLPQIYEVHEMLADEESKKVFRAFILN